MSGLSDSTSQFCPNCKNVVKPNSIFCKHCGFNLITENLVMQNTPPKQPTYNDIFNAPLLSTPSVPNMSPQVYALLKRYTDAYRSARLTVLAGDIVKVVGVFLAVLSLVGGGSSLGSGRGPYGDIVVIGGIAAIVLGLLFAALIFIIGILISGQGQTLKATLDSAVNSSPFLTNEQRARIMSLPLA